MCSATPVKYTICSTPASHVLGPLPSTINGAALGHRSQLVEQTGQIGSPQGGWVNAQASPAEGGGVPTARQDTSQGSWGPKGADDERRHHGNSRRFAQAASGEKRLPKGPHQFDGLGNCPEGGRRNDGCLLIWWRERIYVLSSWVGNDGHLAQKEDVPAGDSLNAGLGGGGGRPGGDLRGGYGWWTGQKNWDSQAPWSLSSRTYVTR